MQPKIGYHGNMQRPGTPLTPTDYLNARSSPSPGEYGSPLSMSHPSVLPNGGKFGLEELPSVIDLHVAAHAFVPGPGKYDDVILPMDKGCAFSTAFVPGSLDLLIKAKGSLPAPGEYFPENCVNISRYTRADLAVPPFTRGLRPSFIDEAQRAKDFIPGPSMYQSKRARLRARTTRQHQRGGNNLGPRRPATVSTYLDNIQHMMETMEIEKHKKKCTIKNTMNTTNTTNNTTNTMDARPMTSPQKFRKEQKQLWTKHKKQFSGSKRSNKNTKRPSTTAGIQTRRPSTSSSIIMDNVANRSRKQLSKKLTSPLWKYEIPKGIKKSSGKQKHSAATKLKPQKHRHHEQTKLENLWQPTQQRPFLSMEETLELAKINVRAIDAASDSRYRKEVLGML